jgi:hypothetical protein
MNKLICILYSHYIIYKMCNHPNCLFIDILQMTNGEKLYVHYDNNLVPILFQYWDENRVIEKEYAQVPLSKPIEETDSEPDENVKLLVSEPLFVYNGTCDVSELGVIDLN